MNIQEEMQDLFEDNGAFLNRRAVPDGLLEEFTGNLPSFLLELWQQHGLGSWANGLYNLCNPHEFNGLLSQVFHADKDFSRKDCYVFAYSAFGELQVWSERHGIVHINLLKYFLDCSGLTKPQKKGDPNIAMVISLALHEDALKSLNAYDDDDKPLFTRARKRLGDLEPGECYGFFPALAMGGAPKLENIKRVKALEHFLFLAQLQQFKLVDYLAQPPRVIREIG